jgi:hypothetical protein
MATAAAESGTREPASNGDKPEEEPQQFDPSRSKGPLLSNCLVRSFVAAPSFCELSTGGHDS